MDDSTQPTVDATPPTAEEVYRVLLMDARLILAHAAENDRDIESQYRAWKARLQLALETGEYPGLTTRLLDAGTPQSPEAEDQPPAYLLWDNERGMWWNPNGQGYTHSVSQAGLYSRDEAVKWALKGALGGLSHATVIVADGAA
jgi:hypothetical protein